MNRFLALPAFLTVLLFSSVHAAEPKPAHCPAISAIQQAGLRDAGKDKHWGLYVVYQYHYYDTPEPWFFAIGVPVDKASSYQDALKKAREALPALSGNPEPTPLEEGQWLCTYNDFSNGYKAHAITPVDWPYGIKG